MLNPRPRILVISCWLAVLLTSAPGACLAQARDNKAEAQRLFKEANTLFTRGMYLDALAKYRQARKAYASYKIDLQIGETLRYLKRYTEAAVYYERFMMSAAEVPGPIIMKVKGQLKTLRERLASVKVSCIEDGVLVEVDGRAQGKTPMDLPVYLEPGDHTLTARKAGLPPFSQKLQLKAGQHISLDVPVTASAPAAPTPAVATGEAEATRKARKRKTIWAYASLGVGAALVATAGVLYGVGLAQGNAAHDDYMAERTDLDRVDAHWQDVEAAETKLVVGHVLVGVGAAALGLSLYHFLTRPSAEERPAVTLAPLAGGALFSVGGSF